MTTDSPPSGIRPRGRLRYPANAQVVRTKRVEAGLTQAELAARVGITQAHVSDIERGVSLPGVRVLHSLATTFGCTVHDLMANTDQADK